MNDVAARAGVSPATVSFVLGGRADRQKISRQTRERVLKAAQDLSYQRNQLARAMVTGKSRIIGVLTVPRAAETIANILTGAMKAASQNDYLLKIVHLSNGAVDDDTITRCVEWRLAGALVVGLTDESQTRLHDAFYATQTPIMLIDNAPLSSWGVRISSDDGQGIRQVVSHLVSLGHRKIGFIGGRPGRLTDWRELSFCEALAEHGLSAPKHWVRQTSWSDQAQIEMGVGGFFQDCGDQLPTAIACSSDAIALIVQRIARSRGLRMPQDLSVVGYANHTLSEYADPALTTIDQGFQEMGSVAARKVIDFAENDTTNESILAQDILLPTRLILRASTAPPRS